MAREVRGQTGPARLASDSRPAQCPSATVGDVTMPCLLAPLLPPTLTQPLSVSLALVSAAPAWGGGVKGQPRAPVASWPSSSLVQLERPAGMGVGFWQRAIKEPQHST